MEELKNVQVGINVKYNNGEVDDYVLIGSFKTFKNYLCKLASDENVISVTFNYK